jgi:hypothetical protein
MKPCASRAPPSAEYLNGQGCGSAWAMRGKPRRLISKCLSSGIELAKRLGAMAGAWSVLLITGHLEDSWREQAMYSGAAGLLCKPIDAGELFLVLKRITAERFGGDGELPDALLEAPPKPYFERLFGHHLECGFALWANDRNSLSRGQTSG